MDAKRWSPLWVFAGGCLTGAALIGWHSRGGLRSASHAERADAWSDVAAPSSKADSVVEEHVQQAGPVAVEVAPRGQGESADTAERDKTESGNSVAEVLARLETEYRERSAPAPAPAERSAASEEPARAPSNEQPRLDQEPPSAVNGATGLKPAASEPAAVVRAAVPRSAEPSPSPARVASSSADDKPVPGAAEEAARLATIRDEQAKALERGQAQLAQMQEFTALQQATLLEQYTLFQLQLLSQSSPAPSSTTVVVAPTRSQRRVQGRGQARGGRIVASLPSSISATDNPWGFDLQPSVLVR